MSSLIFFYLHKNRSSTATNRESSIFCSSIILFSRSRTLNLGFGCGSLGVKSFLDQLFKFIRIITNFPFILGSNIKILNAPGLSSPSGYTSSDDLEFEQRLQAIKKSALEQRKAQEQKVIWAIDYDAPTENNSSSTIGLGTKNGYGRLELELQLLYLPWYLPLETFFLLEDDGLIHSAQSFLWKFCWKIITTPAPISEVFQNVDS